MEYNIGMAARLSLSLPLFLAFAATAAAQTGTVPTKEIVIYNSPDSKDSIYPVMEAARNVGITDLWMQAQLKINKGETFARPFPRTQNYRAYINLPGGIRPGSSVTIKVPFYTQLKEVTPNDLGKGNDQYIDWWNGNFHLDKAFLTWHNRAVIWSGAHVLGDPRQPDLPG